MWLQSERALVICIASLRFCDEKYQRMTASICADTAKSALVILGALLICLGCSTSEGQSTGHGEGLYVEIAIPGLEEDYGLLGGVLGENYYTIDTFYLDEDREGVITTDSLLAHGMYYAVFPGAQLSLQFLVSDDQQFSLKTRAEAPVEAMVVEGSLDNRLLYENLKYELAYQERYGAVRQRLNNAPEGSPEREQAQKDAEDLIAERRAHIEEYRTEHPDAMFTRFKLAGQNPVMQKPKLPNGEIDEEMQVYLYRMDYWDDVDFTDNWLVRTPVYGNKLKNFIEKLVPQRVDSLIKYADYITQKSLAGDSLFKYTANYIGLKYKEPEIMGGDAVYVHMVQNYFTPDLAFWAGEYDLRHLQQDARIRNTSMIGKTGQDITVTDIDGSQISLYDLKGPLKVLYIYTTECDNCRKETPKVLQVYHEWKNRGVDFLALCTDQDESVWKDYVRSNNLDWHNGFDPQNESDYQHKYHVDITPEIYVLDENWEIVGKDLKAFQLPEIFNRHM